MRKKRHFCALGMKDLLKKIRKLEIRVRRRVDETFAGEYQSAFKGQGIEFDEVRPYQYGDDIRNIDWNVTAKTNDVYVKQFRETKEQTLFILFDVSGSEDFGPGAENKLKVGVEMSAIMGFSAMKNGDRVGMATFSDKIEQYFVPKKGRKHLLTMVRTLLTPSFDRKGTDIAYAIDFVRKMLKKRSIVIVVSDFLDDGYHRSLELLARKHEVILIRLFNPREKLTHGQQSIPIVDAETGNTSWIHAGNSAYRFALGQKFEELATNLKQFGNRHKIDLLTIDTGMNEAEPDQWIKKLETFFKQRNRRKRFA